MILQSLVTLYEDLSAKGTLSGPGWAPATASYAICLNDDGTVADVISVKTEQTKGKKVVIAPQEMTVPAPVKRTVGIAANFLCDNSSYILGIDSKGNEQRAKACFEACCGLHKALLSDVDSPAANAVLAFFSQWDPDNINNVTAMQDCLTEIISGVNIVFQFGGEYLHEIKAIREAWQKQFLSGEGKQQGICLVTGESSSVATLHPAIKGIRGAQSSGASLVSFNQPSFCSFGKEQGMNAQTGEYAAFAYGAALNYLIADREHISYIGDTAVLCWAAGADPVYQDAFCGFVFGQQTKYSEYDLLTMMKSLCAGRQVDYDDAKLDPDREFYVLGIAPNAARLSVRFFLRGSFGNIVKNVNAHYDRLEIEKPPYKDRSLSIWRLLNETVNQNSRDKAASPQLSGELLRSILNNSMYPATLLNGIILRIRAEHEINYEKAAILKAFYLKNKNKDVPEEVLTVSLNRETTNTAYVLGRLFSVLEDIQRTANPGINATIKDKFFNSASATPAVVFPQLINLSQKHLKKVERWAQIKFDKQLGEIMGLLTEEFPARLSLPQQGAFQLGYYHQTQAKYVQNNKEEE